MAGQLTATDEDLENELNELMSSGNKSNIADNSVDYNLPEAPISLPITLPIKEVVEESEDSRRLVSPLWGLTL